MKKKKRAGPGRPQGESFARDEILKAAEMAFAEHGYAGTSLREIVKRAHVANKSGSAQPLILFHQMC
jgi:AcrR family transcriptional regulator